MKRRRRDELPTEDDLMIRDVGYILDAKRVAAEIITNLCDIEDEGWLNHLCNPLYPCRINESKSMFLVDWEDMSDDDDDGDSHSEDQDEESVMDGDNDGDDGTSLETFKLSKDTCEIMKCGNLVEKVKWSNKSILH